MLEETRLIRSKKERLEVRRNVESKKTIRSETTIRSEKIIEKERNRLEAKRPFEVRKEVYEKCGPRCEEICEYDDYEVVKLSRYEMENGLESKLEEKMRTIYEMCSVIPKP
ncbi:hypothetical protein Tco_0612381 [Tanacetum coccineum]